MAFYKEHPAFSLPSQPDLKIWRYMDFAKFVDLLERRSLYFCRSDRFSDPFEGAVTKLHHLHDEILLLQLKDKVPDAEKMVRALSERESKYRPMEREWFFINCWHMNEHESEAMWKLYGSGGGSVAIQSTLDGLKKSISTSGDEPEVNIGAVRYIDYGSDIIPKGYSFLRFLHKRRSFAHEQEVRAIVWDPTYSIDMGTGVRPIPNGLSIPVDLDILLSSVHVSPACQQWFVELVKSVTAKYGVKCPVNSSALDDEPLY